MTGEAQVLARRQNAASDYLLQKSAGHASSQDSFSRAGTLALLCGPNPPPNAGRTLSGCRDDPCRAKQSQLGEQASSESPQAWTEGAVVRNKANFGGRPADSREPAVLNKANLRGASLRGPHGLKPILQDSVPRR